MNSSYKYPSQELEEMRQSGIHLLENDGVQLYECIVCGSVIARWQTHAMHHREQEAYSAPTEGRGEA